MKGVGINMKKDNNHDNMLRMLMKKIIINDNAAFILVLLIISLGCVAIFLSVYLPHNLGFMVDLFAMLFSFASLAIELKSEWKKIVQLIMLILVYGTSMSLMASLPSIRNIDKEFAHHEMVKKERENKRLKQVIDREISKQLDQRMDEINNRK